MHGQYIAHFKVLKSQLFHKAEFFASHMHRIPVSATSEKSKAIVHARSLLPLGQFQVCEAAMNLTVVFLLAILIVASLLIGNVESGLSIHPRMGIERWNTIVSISYTPTFLLRIFGTHAQAHKLQITNAMREYK